MGRLTCIALLSRLTRLVIVSSTPRKLIFSRVPRMLNGLLKMIWLWMLEPPWQHSGRDYDRSTPLADLADGVAVGTCGAGSWGADRAVAGAVAGTHRS